MMLLGSNVFTSVVLMHGRAVPLGDIVRRAHRVSGLSVEAWNDLPERDREHRLIDAYYDMRDRCQCDACRTSGPHAADCAVHGAPAFPPGPCDCTYRRI